MSHYAVNITLGLEVLRGKLCEKRYCCFLTGLSNYTSDEECKTLYLQDPFAANDNIGVISFH
jgi:hypothetical protein